MLEGASTPLFPTSGIEAPNVFGLGHLPDVIPEQVRGRTDPDDEIYLTPEDLELQRSMLRYPWMIATIVATCGLNAIRLLGKSVLVKQNQIAIIQQAGVYEFIGRPGRYTFNGLQHEHVRTVDLVTNNPIIDLITKKILRVPQGHLGVVTNQNGHLYVYMPGLYVLGSANYNHYGNINAAANLTEIKVQNDTVVRILNISDQMAYVISRGGKTEILRRGFHWLGVESQILGFFSLQQKTEVLTLTLPNKEGQMVTVTVEIFYQIVKPELAVKLGNNDEQIVRRLEAITSTMVSTAISAHTTEEIALARHLIDADSNTSSSSSKSGDEIQVVDLSLPVEIKRRLGDDYIRQLIEVGLGNIRIATITPQIADETVKMRWQEIGLQRAQIQSEQRNRQIENEIAFSKKQAWSKQQNIEITRTNYERMQTAETALKVANLEGRAKTIAAEANYEAGLAFASTQLGASLAIIRSLGKIAQGKQVCLGPDFGLAELEKLIDPKQGGNP